MEHECALLECDPRQPGSIPMHVFVPGGSYPLWVCSQEHGLLLQKAGAENGADVLFSGGKVQD